MFTSKPTTITQGDESIQGILDGFQVEPDGVTYLVFVPKTPDSGPCICARPLPVGESPRPCPEHGWLGQGFAPSPDSGREADQ